jgi:hypothetical protein
VSAYRTAIDETTRTIDLRARYFRNLIVIVVAIGFVVIVAAVLTRRASALWAWLLLVPPCGAFFYVDARVLNGWRKALSIPWTSHDIDFEVLRQSIRANPAMPKGTTEGMLATLPSADSVATEQQVLTPTRRAIAAANLALHRERANALLLQTIASAVVVSILLAALWSRAWAPLWGLAALALLPAVRVWATRRGRLRCEAEVAACRAQGGFSEEGYIRMRASLR